MHNDHNPPGDQRDESPTKDDLKVQAAVMGLVLEAHPKRLTIGDIVAATAEEEDDARPERAIRDLTGAGLVECSRRRVIPTPAALRFAELEQD